MISPETNGITQSHLDSLNVEQSKNENKAHLVEMGGIDVLAAKLGVDYEVGLTTEQVISLRSRFGTNSFPESPMTSFFSLLVDAMMDPTLLLLLAAASVSLIIGTIRHPTEGYVDGVAIYIAVFLVSNITAGNDYSKELQFRALEASSAKDERCSVLRDASIHRINPCDLVVGDIIVLQAGDSIPADSIIFDHNTILCNESSLTGEPDDLKKNKEKDCFLLSSCLVTEGEECRALVIGIGPHSQWGKIKANLVSEAVNTPLQDKLEEMTAQIGYVGMAAAFATFIAAVVNIWAANKTGVPPTKAVIVDGFLNAFILSVTIIVVAIPEGLPLAVAISLAYSTKKMYADQCFIRVLAACETMGNATNICSDKTGTLTENRMTVVEGWFGNVRLSQSSFSCNAIPECIKRVIVEHVCVNRTAYLVHTDSEGKKLDRPAVIGNKTEGALIEMVKEWGFDYEVVKEAVFDQARDQIFAFNSDKKRSTAVVHRPDGSVRLFCKGASECLLQDCSMWVDKDGNVQPMTSGKKKELDSLILEMANNALRTLLLAHKDYTNDSDIPDDWRTDLPDNSDLCVDCIVGIIDPLRGDVKEAIATAQRAGVLVRMVTGDNIATASAIARQCGILTPNGIAVEGPKFRKMTPKAADLILPNLQVMARSSPNDKLLLVTRLNGHMIPDGREEWEAKHKDLLDATWELDRDKYLPGYVEEWSSTRPDGGEVVGVTGDGTNDAPALKAADVGLAMGITGTKVAQSASDIVILDDRFSSIVRAIMWGRIVYDNIRKFLQFQVTVNVVALVLEFVGAAAGFGQALTAVQMLWVNLVMDTFGALALGTELPTPALLERKPYKRSTSLISRPMWRSILCQSAFQLTLMFILVFKGPELFGVRKGVSCFHYSVLRKASADWDAVTRLEISDPNPSIPVITCSSFDAMCSEHEFSRECFEINHLAISQEGNVTQAFKFSELEDFETLCLSCTDQDYTHGTIIFNTFVWCQLFNEYNARVIVNELNMFAGIHKNAMFLLVSAFTMGLQTLIVQCGGDFVKATSLSASNFFICVGLGAISLVVGWLMRWIPVTEDPKSFADSVNEGSDTPVSMKPQKQTIVQRVKKLFVKETEYTMVDSEVSGISKTAPQV